jgi:hypothetical protein
MKGNPGVAVGASPIRAGVFVFGLLPLLLGALCCTGGVFQTVNFASPNRALRAADYPAVFDLWTREARIIKELDTTLRIHATCFAPEMIAAYVAKQGEVFRLPATEKQHITEKLTAQWSKGYPFLVAASTMDRDWNDFENKDSVWRITLLNDRHQEVLPSSITVERKANATLMEFFPYIGPFHRVYHFLFPKTLPQGSPLIRATTKYFVLRITGPLGHAELIWHIQ